MTEQTTDLQVNVPTRLAGARVAVFNLRERTYTLPDGSERTGNSAVFTLVDTATDTIVGPGSIVNVGDRGFEIVRITVGKDGDLGSVSVRPAS